MKKLPLLRARYAAAFAQVLDGAGMSSTRLLQGANISERLIVENQENWMPVKLLGDFVEAAVHSSGRWDMGLEASMAPRERHSAFSKKYLFMPTLYRSLQSMCENSSVEDTSCNFNLIPNGDMTWLDLGFVEGSQEVVRQIELYRLGALLEVIRLAGGRQWLPPLLHLQSVDDGRLKDVQLLRDVNIRFGTPHLAIQIPTRLLSRSIRAAGSTLKISKVKMERVDTGAFETAMKEVVCAQMRAGVIHIKEIANSLNVSKRTFQRMLKEYDLTFSDLLEQTRVETAQELLAGTDMSHGEISRELGYQHSTHFARAFRRVCGMTPRQYRTYESS